MKIGVLCSVGGSAFFSAYDILEKLDLIDNKHCILITDRDCNAELEAKKRGIFFQRIQEKNSSTFSVITKDILMEYEVEHVFLFFLKMINEILYKNIPTFNIHPSLLPMFKGFGALEKTLINDVRFVGGSLHLATAKADSGAIISQVITPLKINSNINSISKISYLQKVYLTLCGYELLRDSYFNVDLHKENLKWIKKTKFSCSANPEIPNNRIRNMFDEFQKKNGIQVVQ